MSIRSKVAQFDVADWDRDCPHCGVSYRHQQAYQLRERQLRDDVEDLDEYKKLADLSEDARELGGVEVERAVGPDEEVGEVDLPGDGPLGAEALSDLVVAPTAGEEALPLHCRRAGDADDRVEV